MSRMFTALHGAERVDSPAERLDDVPFVEIGGPNGPVFSAPKPAAVVPEPPREFPRLAAPGRFLSVTFHDATAKAKLAPPLEGPDAELVALLYPDHPVSGEYRVLRDEIRAQLPESATKVLLFTAAAPEAGTTTVLLNLAVTLAAEKSARVLVIDANVTRPGVANKLALKSSPGLSEVLAHQLPLTWALQQTAAANLQALSAGAVLASTPAAIGLDLPKLVGQLRQWFDWVLIDGGVWGVVPERDGTCPAADAVYLVTREADVGRSEFTGLRGWVKELGGVLRGYVTTKV
jgi:Mrp family chromosome partitioning ATPase